MDREGDGDTNCNLCARNIPQRLGTGSGRLRNNRTRGNHPDNIIIKTSKNTENSPGDSREILSANSGGKNSQGEKMISEMKCEFMLN